MHLWCRPAGQWRSFLRSVNALELSDEEESVLLDPHRVPVPLDDQPDDEQAHSGALALRALPTPLEHRAADMVEHAAPVVRYPEPLRVDTRPLSQGKGRNGPLSSDSSIGKSRRRTYHGPESISLPLHRPLAPSG